MENEAVEWVEFVTRVSRLYREAENGEWRMENEAVERVEICDSHYSVISLRGEWIMENEAVERMEICDSHYSVISLRGE
jgi:hypothetical protein